MINKTFSTHDRNIVFATTVINTINKQALVLNGKFDTGATICYIKDSLAKGLGLYPLGAVSVKTANASVLSTKYIADVAVEGMVFTDMEITGMPNLETDFLIGMNVILQGKTIIEPSDNGYTVTFSRNMNLF